MAFLADPYSHAKNIQDIHKDKIVRWIFFFLIFRVRECVRVCCACVVCVCGCCVVVVSVKKERMFFLLLPSHEVIWLMAPSCSISVFRPYSLLMNAFKQRKQPRLIKELSGWWFGLFSKYTNPEPSTKGSSQVSLCADKMTRNLRKSSTVTVFASFNIRIQNSGLSSSLSSLFWLTMSAFFF